MKIFVEEFLLLNTTTQELSWTLNDYPAGCHSARPRFNGTVQMCVCVRACQPFMTLFKDANMF